MKIKLFLSLSFVFFALFSASAAEPVEFPQLTSAPVIDGKGDDPAWQGLPWYGDFSVVGTNVVPDAKTAFKAGVWGGELIFLIRAEEPDTSVLKRTRSKRDDMVFFDDCVEVMIDAENFSENLCHIIVNSLGTEYDSYYSQKGMVANPAWNFQKVRSAAFTGKDHFSVEIALPLAELGFVSGDGKIRFNVARQRYGKKREISSFSPAKGSLQVPETFADGVIKVPGLESYAYRLSAPYDLKVKDGKSVTGKIQLHNRSGKLRFVEVLINGKAAAKRAVDANLSCEIAFDLPYKEKLDILVEVRERRHSRLLQSRTVTLEYQPVSIVLDSPGYRDNIYSDEKISAIAGKVQINASDDADKAVQVSLLDAKGAVLVSGTADKEGNFSLPVNILPEGSYTLVIRRGKLSCTKVIRKLPRQDGEVRIARNGVLLVDGKPFTPYGWFRLNPEDGAKEGYKLDFHYNFPWRSDDEVQAYLDNAHKLGLKVISYCYPNGSMMTNAAYKRALSDNEAELIRRRVSKFSTHPALLAWYIADEPEYEPWLRSRLEKVAAVCREADPYHPTVICNNSIDGLLKYRGIGDISMPDYYPGFLENGNAASPIGRYGELLAASKKLDNRAQWGVPQGFTWNAYGSKGHRIPDYTELRNMHYQTLLNGHTGVIWYSYELNYTDPALHIHVAKLRKEMEIFIELWQNPQLRKEPSMTRELAAASYKNVNGEDYLIAVNLTPGDLSIDLASPSGRKFFIAGKKGETVTPEKGRIKDKLARYETRIYTTGSEKAAAFTAEEEKEAVSAALKALHREGNLAYYRANPGLKFTSSTLTDPRIPLYQYCDGAYSSIHVFDRAKDPRCEVTLIFPEKVKISRLELYGRDIRSFKVRTPVGEFGRYKAGDQSFGRVQSVSPVETDRISVYDFDGFGISEIEIYSEPK